jgi:RNA polymerase sigma-70 factor (ECF subfamily)
VLHDIFALPFEEIAPIVGRSPTAARRHTRRPHAPPPARPGVPQRLTSLPITVRKAEH